MPEEEYKHRSEYGEVFFPRTPTSALTPMTGFAEEPWLQRICSFQFLHSETTQLLRRPLVVEEIRVRLLKSARASL